MLNLSLMDLLIATFDEMPISVTLADYTEDDMPLIYVNRAFTDVTGYSYEEAIGRNCRFLQGEGTDKNATASIRKSLENGECVCIDILNYRKDGSAFWNGLEMSPIRDQDGKIIAYCGFQMDLSKHKLMTQVSIERQRRANDVLEKRLRSSMDEIDRLLQPASCYSNVKEGVQDGYGDVGEVFDNFFENADNARKLVLYMREALSENRQKQDEAGVPKRSSDPKDTIN